MDEKTMDEGLRCKRCGHERVTRMAICLECNCECDHDPHAVNGETMVLDMVASVAQSDRSDADVGLMVRRILNEPTLKAIRKAASAPAAPQPRETCCDPDVPHYYGLPATGCFNCFPPGSPDPYASTDDGKGASPESAGGDCADCPEPHRKCLSCGKAQGGSCGACHCGERFRLLDNDYHRLLTFATPSFCAMHCAKRESGHDVRCVEMAAILTAAKKERG